MAKGDPMEAIKISTWGGGDCDTLAAITGAIWGAYRGVEALSIDMLETVDAVNNIDLELISKRYYEVVQNINPKLIDWWRRKSFFCLIQ